MATTKCSIKMKHFQNCIYDSLRIEQSKKKNKKKTLPLYSDHIFLTHITFQADTVTKYKYWLHIDNIIRNKLFLKYNITGARTIWNFTSVCNAPTLNTTMINCTFRTFSPCSLVFFIFVSLFKNSLHCSLM